jgi:hypothetical protein
MKKKIFYCVAIAMVTTCLFFSCSKSDGELLAENEHKELLVVGLVDDFRKFHNGQATKADIESDLVAGNIRYETYSFDGATVASDVEASISAVITSLGQSDPSGSSSSITFGGSNTSEGSNLAGILDAWDLQIPGTVEVEVANIEFEIDGQSGFSVAVNDDHLKGVYAYSENGSFADTSFNIGFKDALYALKGAIRQNLVGHYMEQALGGAIETRSTTDVTHHSVGPLTGLSWNQCAPYNLDVPYLCSDLVGSIYAGRAPAGCTSIAMAQLLAYMAPPALRFTYSLLSLRNKNFVDGATTGTLVNEVKSFVYYLGSIMQMSYSCSGSGAYPTSLVLALQTWGVWPAAQTSGCVSYPFLVSYITQGFPQIVWGYDSGGSGHTWIWEGVDFYYTTFANGVYNIVQSMPYQVYCNWGWGGTANGWYAWTDKTNPRYVPYNFLDNISHIQITATTHPIPN